ncbi:unnamed protein product [Arabidopsis thaliana]|uniref:FBD domain-containing protein n=1 Tax=Arabidopsis thaliana TaxID=3702 RepID=A0A654GC02_ARATH|nr:unnamed protein product [Arabidopsis thaliana]
MDIISTLSDDLLLKILSELPTKYVVASTILSKRWKNLWTMVQKFDFDDNFELEPSNYGSFLKCVNRSMVFHKAPVLETLKFKVGPCCSYEDITTWITIGMVRGVRELDIRHCNADFKDKKHSLIKLPNSLYTYEKLECSKATNLIVGLYLVCPVLEELMLDNARNDDDYMSSWFYNEFDIFNPIKYGNMIVINVPSLKYLSLVDFNGDSYLCENMPEVIEAIVKVVHKSPMKLLGSLPSVKNLYLCLTNSVLCQDSPGWWGLLTWMLDNSPKLQVLKLGKCKERCFISSIESHWRGPISVPECLRLHLSTFEWKYYNGRDEEKKKVAYILKNARQLKTAAFSVQRVFPMKERFQKHKEVVSLHRASSSCKLMLD